jgi:hypothetical protein
MLLKIPKYIYKEMPFHPRLVDTQHDVDPSLAMQLSYSLVRRIVLAIACSKPSATIVPFKQVRVEDKSLV